MQNPQEPYFSTTRVAEVLGVSRITVFRYIKEGKLKANKYGRNYGITESAFHDFQYEYLMTDEDREFLKKAVFKMFDGVREGLEQQRLREQGFGKSHRALED